MMREMSSNNGELADGGLLLKAAFIKPLPTGGPWQDATVLGLAAVRLRRPGVGRVPVFVWNAEAALVYPGALSHHVVDAQPDLLIWADALADVVSELVILIAGCWRTEDTAQGVTVFTGTVVGFSHRVSQVTLVMDLCTFQTDWREK